MKNVLAICVAMKKKSEQAELQLGVLFKSAVLLQLVIFFNLLQLYNKPLSSF